MIIKFKDGYTVTVTDCAGTDKASIIKAAKQAHDACVKAKDAELTKVVNTNVSFQPTKIKAAIQKHDDEALNREVAYLKRDIEADLKHQNYVDMYRHDVLKEIVEKYEEAINMLKSAGHADADELLNNVRLIRGMWEIQTYDVTVGNNVVTVDSLKKAIDTANNAHYKNPNETVTVMDNSTGEIILELSPAQNNTPAATDSKTVKDVPFYEPTDAPRIKSEYSPDRVTREIAHNEEENANFDELKKVIEEIDEFIEKGRSVLVEAGWTREDARHAIRERYYALVKALRDASLDDIAEALERRIHKLERVWDLTR